MSSEVETSRDRTFKAALRDSSTSLGRTDVVQIRAAIIILFLLLGLAIVA